MRKSTYSENEDVNQGREQKIINIFNMCAKEGIYILIKIYKKSQRKKLESFSDSCSFCV